MRRIAGILFVLGALAWLAGCASTANVAGPKIDAAKKAVDDAKAAGADKICPDEYQSAEMKLKQAQLLKADNDDAQAAKAADQSVGLADVAKKCVEAHNAPAPAAVEAAAPPEELKKFKTSIYFDFNSNVIKPAERQKLDQALAQLKKWAADHKFYVLVSGYTDPPGADEENMALAKRRCLVTRFYLSTNGFNIGQIYMQALDGHPELAAAEAPPANVAPPPAAVANRELTVTTPQTLHTDTVLGAAGVAAGAAGVARPTAVAASSTGKTSNKKDAEKRRVDITVVFARPANLSTEAIPADF